MGQGGWIWKLYRENQTYYAILFFTAGIVQLKFSWFLAFHLRDHKLNFASKIFKSAKHQAQVLVADWYHNYHMVNVKTNNQLENKVQMAPVTLSSPK